METMRWKNVKIFMTLQCCEERLNAYESEKGLLSLGIVRKELAVEEMGRSNRMLV
jgi:hypothetical protein